MLAVLLSGSCWLPAAAGFDISAIEKAQDKVTVAVQAERAVFTVVSANGIGGFKCALKSGQWPCEVSIIVHRKALENFGLETDRIRAKGAVKSAANCWCYFEFRNGAGKFNHEYSAGSLRVSVKETLEGIELIFPPNLFADTKQFSFGWIDAYRR